MIEATRYDIGEMVDVLLDIPLHTGPWLDEISHVTIAHAGRADFPDMDIYAHRFVLESDEGFSVDLIIENDAPHRYWVDGIEGNQQRAADSYLTLLAAGMFRLAE